MNLLDPCRVEELVRLFDGGASDRAAARATGISRGAVARYRCAWRGDRCSRGWLVGAPVDTIVVRLPRAVGEQLAGEADRRGTSPAALAAGIIASVAEERYYSAVLDS